MASYYNEIDPYAAQWLRNLIAAGLIAPGDVDERSIIDVKPDDLKGYRQCHFFAGIGGWSLAFRIAGIPDDYPAWSGSPPCQDASLIGAVWGVRTGLRGGRTSLVRQWLDLAEESQPCRLYFENVPGIKKWLPEIEGRLARARYRFSKSERSTADIGGTSLRRRVWIAAHRDGAGLEEPWATGPSPHHYIDPRRTPPGDVWVAAPGRPGGMEDGFPERVAAIRAFGNAIDPWVAAKFIRSVTP